MDWLATVLTLLSGGVFGAGATVLIAQKRAVQLTAGYLGIALATCLVLFMVALFAR